LDRSASTVQGELARNSCLSGYMTSTADHNARTSR